MQHRQPLIRELTSVEPATLACALEPLGGLAFLDSGPAPTPLGRWSFLAADPFGRFEIKSGRAFWNGEAIAGDPFTALRQQFALYHTEPLQDLPPLTSGAIGYIAYEMGRAFETLPSLPPSRLEEADLSFGFYDVIIAHDALTGKTYLASSGLPERDEAKRIKRAEERLTFFEAHIASTKVTRTPNEPLDQWQSNFTKASYQKAVADIIESILNGDIFQANLSQCFSASRPLAYDPFAFYCTLRTQSPAPFGAYLDCGALTIASNSPERFLQLDHKGGVEARPIKGTAPRATDPDQDRALAHALLQSEKDRAENTMIVDLLRNDLSRIAQSGSVRVPTLCGLETYANVHHLVSSVEAHLKPQHDLFDLLAATFPGGSITGAPKIKAMDIIAREEKIPRGVYCGSIGYLSFDGRMDLNIAIRTASFTPTEIRFSVGGGVTALSDPAAEYHETLVKADRLFKAFRHDARRE